MQILIFVSKMSEGKSIVPLAPFSDKMREKSYVPFSMQILIFVFKMSEGKSIVPLYPINSIVTLFSICVEYENLDLTSDVS